MALSLKVWRIWLLVYNGSLALIAIVAIILQFYLLFHVLTYTHFIEDKGIIAISLIIFNGFLTLISARVGWKVVHKSSMTLVILFGILLILLFVCNLVCFIGILCMLHTFKDEVTARIETTFKMSIEDESYKYLKLWESLQIQLKCCGIGGPTDYRVSKAVPWSCCKRSSYDATNDAGDCTSVYQKGCLLSIYNNTFDYMMYFAIISLILALIQLLGSVCYFDLAKLIKKKAVAEVQLPSIEEPQEARMGLFSRPQKR